MSGLRGVLAGSLALVALHTLVAYRGPGQRLKELVGPKGILTGFVDRFLDPTVPAIAERGKGAAWELPFGKPSVSTGAGGGGGGTRQQATAIPAPSTPRPVRVI